MGAERGRPTTAMAGPVGGGDSNQRAMAAVAPAAAASASAPS